MVNYNIQIALDVMSTHSQHSEEKQSYYKDTKVRDVCKTHLSSSISPSSISMFESFSSAAFYKYHMAYYSPTMTHYIRVSNYVKCDLKDKLKHGNVNQSLNCQMIKYTVRLP